MACKRSAVRSRLPPPNTMHKLGVITILMGLILSIAGLIVGFWEMFNGNENAEFWLSLIPLGFVGLFVGVTITQLSDKRDDASRNSNS